MRLTPLEQEAIKSSFREAFPRDDHIWLFGSRLDDTKRGGDIDLYIETHLLPDEAVRAKGRFLILLQTKIGEQRIDIVLNLLSLKQSKPIYSIAREGHLFS